MITTDFETIAGLTAREHVVSDSAHTVRLARDYDYAIEDVWSAWTDPERLARWLGVLRGEPIVGGRVDLVMAPPDGDVAELVITECEAPESVAVRWSGWGEPESAVRVELSALEAGRTRLTLVHSELVDSNARGYGAGWEEFLQLLQVTLDGSGTRDHAGYERKALEQHLAGRWDAVAAHTAP